MAKKILRFIESINEVHHEDEDDLNDILLDLKDELIEFEVIKGYFSEDSLKKNQMGSKVFNILHDKPCYESDKYCFCIKVPLSQLKDMKLSMHFSGRSLISDNKIFTIFSELRQISGRYENCLIYLDSRTNTTAGVIQGAIYLFVLIDTEIDKIDKDRIELIQIFNELKTRNSLSRSDFSYNTTINMTDDNIVITTLYEYTDRKFSRFIRGINLENFNIETSKSSGVVEIIISYK